MVVLRPRPAEPPPVALAAPPVVRTPPPDTLKPAHVYPPGPGFPKLSSAPPVIVDKVADDARAERLREDEEYVRDARAKRVQEDKQRVIDARAQVEINMYSTGWCPACRQARTWLLGHGFSFQDHDVERDPSARARYHELNPAGTIPTFEIDQSPMVGFSAPSMLAAIDRAADIRSRR